LQYTKKLAFSAPISFLRSVVSLIGSYNAAAGFVADHRDLDYGNLDEGADGGAACEQSSCD
jgi:hypothetical protein